MPTKLLLPARPPPPSLRIFRPSYSPALVILISKYISTDRGTLGLILRLKKNVHFRFYIIYLLSNEKKANLGLLWSRMLKKSMIVVTLC